MIDLGFNTIDVSLPFITDMNFYGSKTHVIYFE